MKIVPIHYNYMLQALSKVDINAVRLSALNSGKQPRDMEKLIRWDCVFVAHLLPWLSANVYSYANDANIDTALKSIFKELKQ